MHMCAMQRRRRLLCQIMDDAGNNNITDSRSALSLFGDPDFDPPRGSLASKCSHLYAVCALHLNQPLAGRFCLN
jgi:hypothetical protein